MKIISLNTWGGRAMHPLMHFFKEHGPNTDIFCLQEMHDTSQKYRETVHPDEWVRWDLLEKTKQMLPDHVSYFARWEDNPDRMSVATFVRRDIAGAGYDDPVIHVPAELREHGSAVIPPRKALRVDVLRGHETPRRWLAVVNYHGMWNGDGKGDTPEREEQSRKLATFMEDIKGPKVLMGDMNFAPDTESFGILAQPFHEELVTKFAIGRGTRTPLYRHFGKPDHDRYADYMFVDGVVVKDFRVMDDLVSDHAPLYLEIVY